MDTASIFHPEKAEMSEGGVSDARTQRVSGISGSSGPNGPSTNRHLSVASGVTQVPSQPRILMYAAGVAGLGQTRRAMRLAEYVCARSASASVLLVSGVPNAAAFFRHERCRVDSPPEIVDLVRQAQAAGTLRLPPALPAEVTKVLLQAAAEFDPQVFLTTTHSGIAGELGPVLTRLGGRGCRRLLALRDIYFPPRFVEEFEVLSEDDFDRVLIAGPPMTSRWTPDGLLRGEISHLVEFVGYLRPTEVHLRRRLDGQPVVRCQVGGGSDGYALATAVIDVAHSLRSGECDFVLEVATGPQMPEADRDALRDRSDNLTTVVEQWIPDPFGSAAQARRPDLVVSMAGYNACTEAAWFGAPTILCPRRRSNDREQQIRAQQFVRLFDNFSLLGEPDPWKLKELMRDPPLWRADSLKDPQRSLFADIGSVVDLILGSGP